MSVIYSTDSSISQRIQLVLGAGAEVVRSTAELRHNLELNPGRQLVVIGQDIALETALDLAREHRTSQPALGFVLLRNRLEVGMLSAALQAGVREVVAADDATELLAAAQRSLSLSSAIGGAMNAPMNSSAPDKRGRMVLVFSAKGGCGKTTVSTNLAQALAQDTSKSVCLVDFDLQFGDVAIALQIEPTKTISDAIRIQQAQVGKTVDAQDIASLVTSYRPNLDVLLAPLNPSDVEFVTPNLAHGILTALRQRYDFVVIDAPPAFTEVILRAFDLADQYLLLTTLDTPSLKNLKVTLDTLTELGLPTSKWKVVVNRSTARAGVSIADVEKATGQPVYAAIPASDVVPNTTNRGQTVVSAQPRHRVAKAIRAIAADIASSTENLTLVAKGVLLS